LTVFVASRHLNQPVLHRLAFRELGLAIGLKALPIIADAIKKDTFGNWTVLRRTVDLLLPYESLSEDIVSVWLPYAQNQDQIWQSHQDINDVMLATALIPDMFLLDGERVLSKAP
jgi:hypothetical protein